MIVIEKRYILREVAICVNKRIITYDYDLSRAIYTYNGINKEEFKINYARWNKIVEKYKLYRDYSFCKHEAFISFDYKNLKEEILEECLLHREELKHQVQAIFEEGN